MLGSGQMTKQYQADGWVCVDANPAYEPDYVYTMPPLPDMGQKWHEICAIHFIEHLYKEDAKLLISQIYDALMSGGKLILEQANLDYVCRVVLGEIAPPVARYPWMDGNADWFGMYQLYPQPHLLHGNDLNRHRYMYTPKTLTDLVVECGFNQVEIKTAVSHVRERDFRLEAIK